MCKYKKCLEYLKRFIDECDGYEIDEKNKTIVFKFESGGEAFIVNRFLAMIRMLSGHDFTCYQTVNLGESNG